MDLLLPRWQEPQITQPQLSRELAPAIPPVRASEQGTSYFLPPELPIGGTNPEASRYGHLGIVVFRFLAPVVQSAERQLQAYE